MARTVTITNINNNTGDVTVNVVYDTLTKTFTISGLPLSSKAEIMAALKDHLRAYLAGRKAEKAQAPAAGVAGMVNNPETIDVGEEG